MWPTRPTKGLDWCSFHWSLSVVQWDLRYIFHWDMLQFEAKECFSTETWHWSGWVVAFTESQGLKKKTALWWVSLLRNQAGVVLPFFTKLWDILQQIVYFCSSYIKDTSGKQTKFQNFIETADKSLWNSQLSGCPKICQPWFSCSQDKCWCQAMSKQISVASLGEEGGWLCDNLFCKTSCLSIALNMGFVTMISTTMSGRAERRGDGSITAITTRKQ